MKETIFAALKDTCKPAALGKVAVRGAITEVALTIAATAIVAGISSLKKGKDVDCEKEVK